MDDSSSAEGVEVKLFNMTTRIVQTLFTDKQGAYNFSGLAPGNYEFRMKKEGYSFEGSGLIIHLYPGNTINPLYQLLNEKYFGCLSGTITLEDGSPATGAQVRLLPGDLQANQHGRAAVTDENGKYTIKNAAGNYQIKLEKKGYALELKKITLVAQDAIENYDFQLTPGAEVSGKVFDNFGKPLANATMNLRRVRQDGGEDIDNAYHGFAVSDEQGGYKFDGVKPGAYKIRAAPKTQSLEGISIPKECFYPGIPHANSSEIVNIGLRAQLPNMDIYCGLQMSGFIASGMVIDSTSGMPAPNIRLVYGAASDFQQIGFLEKSDVATNSNGEFRIEGLKPGKYWLKTSLLFPSDYYSLPQLFTIKDRDVANLEHMVQKGVRISGSVHIDNGLTPKEENPNLAFTIFFEPDPIYKESEVQYANRINMGMTKNSGFSGEEAFTIHGAPPRMGKLSYSEKNEMGNTYSARIERDGVDLQKPFQVGDQDITDVKITLYRNSGIIAGYIYDEEGKLNTERTEIVAVLKNSLYGYFSKLVNVNKDGRFVIKDLPKGEYDVRAVFHYDGSLSGSLGSTIVNVSDKPATIEMKVRAPISETLRNSARPRN